MDVATVGFGLLFSYSSVAVVVMEETVLELVMAVVAADAVTITAIAANGLLFFLFSSAAAAEITVSAANLL